jgi:hypothetical protein
MWLYKILKKYRHGIDQRCISDHQCFYRFRKKMEFLVRKPPLLVNCHIQRMHSPSCLFTTTELACIQTMFSSKTQF